MSMFDSIRCSMDIGELTDSDCQTKDIDPYIGGTMSFYWVDPSGLMWTVDFSGTADFVFTDSLKLRERVGYIFNGNRGRVHRVYLTDYITIYNSKTSPDGLVEFVECRLHFIEGKLQSYTYINNHIEN